MNDDTFNGVPVIQSRSIAPRTRWGAAAAPRTAHERAELQHHHRDHRRYCQHEHGQQRAERFLLARGLTADLDTDS